ncbi:RNA polymerase sigma factor [Flexithrix dorotheae]|uniref:RNA polymerase sigma factor n=1 Tax=Flexithrix dorotheae TaxID=70993 RepID=UPI000373CFE9|nr:sigma-70 family RNA polymerase sigma factor [Flexithrix dorotheae]
MQEKSQKLVDHLFRHESGKMVAVLTRVFGLENLELAQDVVQETMIKALNDWRFEIPQNPNGWLYRVAKNKAIDILRRNRKISSSSPQLQVLLQSEWSLSPTIENLFLEEEIQDSQLRMIFSCCHPSLKLEAQIALTLKTLCGFSHKEIASAFLTNEETISKRIQRAKKKIIQENIPLEVPLGKALHKRLKAVLKSIYLLFNEGYYSANSNTVIKKDICLEAMRLTILLISHPNTNTPSTHALLSLMCFHAARFEARTNEAGEVILLPFQNRKLWNKELIEKGFYHFQFSQKGIVTEYHLEAAIASIHCTAEHYEETNWKTILSLYDQLLTLKPSPIIKLNRAIALGKVIGPVKAIQELLKLAELKENTIYHTTLGDFYKECGEDCKAQECYQLAYDCAQTEPEKKFLLGKIGKD